MCYAVHGTHCWLFVVAQIWYMAALHLGLLMPLVAATSQARCSMLHLLQPASKSLSPSGKL